MRYNPEIHKRRSTRLKGYDYSQAGLYFITICCHNRQCFFGTIENHEMILNDVGKIADEYWLEIPKHFPHVVLHEHIVMPNHVHGIIELTDVGTRHVVSLHVASQHRVLQQNQFSKPIAGSLSVIIRQYKSSVKRWCNKNEMGNFKWQSRFHDHIIRDEKSFQRISDYIMDNPAKWNQDRFKSSEI